MNDELVHDSTGSRLAQLHGARVEIVPEEIALRLYGSRATAGVFRVWLDSSHVQAR